MIKQETPLAITVGEPAGIGPDLAVSLLANPHAVTRRMVLIADRSLLEQRAHDLCADVAFCEYGRPHAGCVEVLHVPLAQPVTAGILNPANASYVLKTLDCALTGCQDGTFAAMVTAPVHKGVINEAGIPFTGHTEYLAQKTGTDNVVMMLVGGGMRVALATTHLPLCDVPKAITQESLLSTITILVRELQTRFHLTQPAILVAGLNPHAGEGGHLGTEELDVIEPVLAILRAQGFCLKGPLPADTLFNPTLLQEADAVLAMYHDQGLPVLKYASFGAGVNVTLGLPVVRTSVDHGTALSLAGTGKAHNGSLLAAIQLADELTHH